MIMKRRYVTVILVGAWSFSALLLFGQGGRFAGLAKLFLRSAECQGKAAAERVVFGAAQRVCPAVKATQGELELGIKELAQTYAKKPLQEAFEARLKDSVERATLKTLEQQEQKGVKVLRTSLERHLNDLVKMEPAAEPGLLGRWFGRVPKTQLSEEVKVALAKPSFNGRLKNLMELPEGKNLLDTFLESFKKEQGVAWEEVELLLEKNINSALKQEIQILQTMPESTSLLGTAKEIPISEVIGGGRIEVNPRQPLTDFQSVVQRVEGFVVPEMSFAKTTAKPIKGVTQLVEKEVVSGAEKVTSQIKKVAEEVVEEAKPVIARAMPTPGRSARIVPELPVAPRPVVQAEPVGIPPVPEIKPSKVVSDTPQMQQIVHGAPVTVHGAPVTVNVTVMPPQPAALPEAAAVSGKPSLAIVKAQQPVVPKLEPAVELPTVEKVTADMFRETRKAPRSAIDARVLEAVRKKTRELILADERERILATVPTAEKVLAPVGERALAETLPPAPIKEADISFLGNSLAALGASVAPIDGSLAQLTIPDVMFKKVIDLGKKHDLALAWVRKSCLPTALTMEGKWSSIADQRGSVFAVIGHTLVNGFVPVAVRRAQLVQFGGVPKVPDRVKKMLGANVRPLLAGSTAIESLPVLTQGQEIMMREQALIDRVVMGDGVAVRIFVIVPGAPIPTAEGIFGAASREAFTIPFVARQVAKPSVLEIIRPTAQKMLPWKEQKPIDMSSEVYRQTAETIFGAVSYEELRAPRGVFERHAPESAISRLLRRVEQQQQDTCTQPLFVSTEPTPGAEKEGATQFEPKAPETKVYKAQGRLTDEQPTAEPTAFAETEEAPFFEETIPAQEERIPGPQDKATVWSYFRRLFSWLKIFTEPSKAKLSTETRTQETAEQPLSKPEDKEKTGQTAEPTSFAEREEIPLFEETIPTQEEPTPGAQKEGATQFEPKAPEAKLLPKTRTQKTPKQPLSKPEDKKKTEQTAGPTSFAEREEVPLFEETIPTPKKPTSSEQEEGATQFEPKAPEAKVYKAQGRLTDEQPVAEPTSFAEREEVPLFEETIPTPEEPIPVAQKEAAGWSDIRILFPWLKSSKAKPATKTRTQETAKRPLSKPEDKEKTGPTAEPTAFAETEGVPLFEETIPTQEEPTPGAQEEATTQFEPKVPITKPLPKIPIKKKVKQPFAKQRYNFKKPTPAEIFLKARESARNALLEKVRAAKEVEMALVSTWLERGGLRSIVTKYYLDEKTPFAFNLFDVYNAMVQRKNTGKYFDRASFERVRETIYTVLGENKDIEGIRGRLSSILDAITRQGGVIVDEVKKKITHWRMLIHV